MLVSLRAPCRVLAVALAMCCVAMSGARAQQTITVFAAASLQNALKDEATAFTAETGIAVKYSFDSSSTLAKQIEQGAPADLFASADLRWMDYVADKGLIDPKTRINLLHNALVVVAPKDSPLTTLKLDQASIDAALKGGRIATGAVDSVPAGIYAKQALTKLGLWDAYASRIASAENVRAALAYVARGEAPLGIVYATDAAAEANVKVVAIFPEDSHPQITYPFAVTKAAKGDGAAKFLAFLKSPAAKPAFTKQGFTFAE